MGLRVHHLPDQMLIALELSLRKSAPLMKDNDIIQVFYGLALLKFRWEPHLTSETKEVLSIAVYNKVTKWQADIQAKLIKLLVEFYLCFTINIHEFSVSIVSIYFKELTLKHYSDRSKAQWKWLHWYIPWLDCKLSGRT